MDIRGKSILIAAQFSPPYGSNFIPSLESLSFKLKNQYGCSIAFVFPSKASDYEWYKTLASYGEVFFANTNEKESLQRIFSNVAPDIVYTHFEGYDTVFLPFANKSTRFVWHMHDAFSYQKNILKKFYQYYCFFRHYGLPFFKNKISIIAVNGHELRFVRPYRLWKKTSTAIIPNGIDFNRLVQHEIKISNTYTFLAFGGRNVQKRIDTILKAANLLENKGYKFKIIITKGTDTIDVIKSIYGAQYPNWLSLEDQSENINELLQRIDCFISSSIVETFSYAIAEMLYVGKPVIMSDIEGTAWAKNYASVQTFPVLNEIKLAECMQLSLTTTIDKHIANCNASMKQAIKNLNIHSWCNKVCSFIQRF